MLGTVDVEASCSGTVLDSASRGASRCGGRGSPAMSALKPDATASTSSAAPNTLKGRGDLRIVGMKSFNS